MFALYPSASLFQFTLPRGERHNGERLTVGLGSVSIHAPARGATSMASIVREPLKRFNSRSREGSDKHVAEL